MGARTGFAVVLSAVLFAAAPAGAATITVNTTTDELTAGQGCSLREAIATVNGNGDGACASASGSGNTIVLRATTYPLTLQHFLFIGPPPTGCISTDLPRSNDNSQDELSIAGTVRNLVIQGAGPGQTVIDACKLGDRALEVNPGATVTLKDLTITNGNAQDGTNGTNGGTFGSTGGGANPGSDGGGIRNEGTLTLTDSAVTDSHAGYGGTGGEGGPLGGSGGIGGSGGNGGGIFSSGTLTVTGSTISGNSGGNGGAGGIGIQGSTSNAQSGNGGSGGPGQNGGGGGGISNEDGSATINTSTITGNRTGAGGAGQPGQNSDPNQGNGGNGGTGGSGGNGAGIASAGSVITAASLHATNDTVEGNTTGNGANAGNPGGAASDIFTAGRGGDGGDGGWGAGLINLRSATHLLNVTIAANATGTGASGGAASASFPAGSNGTTGHGGGLYADSSSPTLQNTLLYENETGGDCRGTISNGGHNLVFSPPSLGGLVSDRCNLTGFSTGDPKLAALAGNGGPTQTMRLQPGSAAIDQVPASGAGCPSTDQRGVPRPGGSACDIGAYEVARPKATTGPASQVGSTAATISATVAANANDATVHFQYGTSKSYGSGTAGQHTSGVADVSMHAHVAGLTTGTTYHYRVVASSVDGTTYGTDRTFEPNVIKTTTVLVKGLKVKPKRVHRKRGAKVSYTDSVGATVHFVLRRCTKFVNKRCKRWRRVRSFKHHDVVGRNSFHLGVKRLKLGLYQLVGTPYVGSRHGSAVKVTFRIVL